MILLLKLLGIIVFIIIEFGCYFRCFICIAISRYFLCIIISRRCLMGLIIVIVVIVIVIAINVVIIVSC